MFANSFRTGRSVFISDKEHELYQLHQYFVELSELTKKENDIHKSHSIDAAIRNHKRKSNPDIIQNTIND